MAMGPSQLHMIVHGKVQGVHYRKYTQRQAKQLGLKGWVRNLADGTVEVQAEGPESALQELEIWCEKKGSPKSKVEGIASTYGPATGECTSFEIRR
ncbi:Acylphosphatase [Diplonema papillatum]|nr:Acylphosphatase [Diplonema papillatum]